MTIAVLATAYCDSGITASGVHTRPGIVAVDPRRIPLGTRLRILVRRFAGRTFIAADTGGLIKGRRLDIFMPSCKRAIVFGAQRVLIAEAPPKRQAATEYPPILTPVPALSRLLRGRRVPCPPAHPWYAMPMALGDAASLWNGPLESRPIALATRAY